MFRMCIEIIQLSIMWLSGEGHHRSDNSPPNYWPCYCHWPRIKMILVTSGNRKRNRS